MMKSRFVQSSGIGGGGGGRGDDGASDFTSLGGGSVASLTGVDGGVVGGGVYVGS